MVNAPRCKVCGEESRPKFAAGGYRFFQCIKCRTSFVDPTPSAEELADYYNTFHLSTSLGGQYDAIEPRMGADFPAKRTLLLRALSNVQGRVLDVGCGKGYFVKECRDVGIDACGIDLSESAIHHAIHELGVPAYCGDISELSNKIGQFDAVTFWATIEHLPDPIATLKAIGTVMRPGSHLLLDTGVGDDWLDRLLPGCVQWYDPPQHLFVFSIAGITQALTRSGFRIIGLDQNFERSTVRKYAKAARNGICAAAFRSISDLCRLDQGIFQFTRFQIGNLMSVHAVKD